MTSRRLRTSSAQLNEPTFNDNTHKCFGRESNFPRPQNPPLFNRTTLQMSCCSGQCLPTTITRMPSKRFKDFRAIDFKKLNRDDLMTTQNLIRAAQRANVQRQYPQMLWEGREPNFPRPQNPPVFNRTTLQSHVILDNAFQKETNQRAKAAIDVQRRKRLWI